MDPLMFCCCGLDVHRDMIEACILRGLDQAPEVIRHQFSTTGFGLEEMTVWLAQHDCAFVAMESTGVYWKPVYRALEASVEFSAGIWLVNANHMRNLPGRKSDVADAEWIATLLRHGLLEKSFVPQEDIQNLRELSRLHRTFVQERCRYVNRLEKFLQAHGFKFSSVMSDILSTTGQKLLNLLADKQEITQEDAAALCRRLKKHSQEEIACAVCGKINDVEQRLLKHLLHKVDSAREDIESILEDMRSVTAHYSRQMEIIDSVPGFDETSSMEIIAEISAAPQEHFSSAEKLCSWAGVVPRNDESAGKTKSKRTLHKNKYLKSALCQAAWAAVRTRNTQFHDWFWSHQGKLGQKKAIIAVARKLLKLIYFLLSNNQLYRPLC